MEFMSETNRLVTILACCLVLAQLLGCHLIFTYSDQPTAYLKDAQSSENVFAKLDTVAPTPAKADGQITAAQIADAAAPKNDSNVLDSCADPNNWYCNPLTLNGNQYWGLFCPMTNSKYCMTCFVSGSTSSCDCTLFGPTGCTFDVMNSSGAAFDCVNFKPTTGFSSYLINATCTDQFK